MKKVLIVFLLIMLPTVGYTQYRWEFSAGILNSKLNFETETNEKINTNAGVGFQLNVGYEYLLDQRAKTSVVFAGEILQRSSDITSGTFAGENIKTLQFGFSPKFRVLFGKDIRGFVNVGPSFRINTSVRLGGERLEANDFEQVIVGGVYGGGVSIAAGEMFDFIAEVGVMNDFVSTVTASNSSKFFDIYARIGLRFRVYDR